MFLFTAGQMLTPVVPAPAGPPPNPGESRLTGLPHPHFCPERSVGHRSESAPWLRSGGGACFNLFFFVYPSFILNISPFLNYPESLTPPLLASQ